MVDLFNGLTSTAANQNTDWVNLMSRQFNGILPSVWCNDLGFTRWAGPTALVQGRREMSDVEVAALEKDPNFNLFQQFASKITKNYPIVGSIGYQARNRDWLGREIEASLLYALRHQCTVRAGPDERHPAGSLGWTSMGLGHRLTPAARSPQATPR